MPGREPAPAPEEWVWAQNRMLGDQWPQADETELVRLKELWRELGAGLEALARDGGGAVNQVLGSYGGETGVEISAKWQTLTGGGGIGGLLERAAEAGDTLLTAAALVSTAKYDIDSEISDRLTDLYFLLQDRPAYATAADPFPTAQSTLAGDPVADGVINVGANRIGNIVEDLAGDLAALRFTPFEPGAGTLLAQRLEGSQGVPPAPQREPITTDGLPPSVAAGGGIMGVAADTIAMLDRYPALKTVTKAAPVLSGLLAGFDEALTDNGHSGVEQAVRSVLRGGVVGFASVVPFAGMPADWAMEESFEMFDAMRDGWHEDGLSGAFEGREEEVAENWREIGDFWDRNIVQPLENTIWMGGG